MKEWLAKKGLEKWFQKDNLIILVLSGILLFIIALPTKDTSSEQENSDLQMINGGTGQKTESTEEGGAMQVYSSEFDYAASLEEQLEEALEGMEGVGRVTVMITLQASEELVVEKDEPISRTNTTETDSSGGNRVTAQYESSESTIYSTDDSGSEPYVVKRILPRIEGVLVVAQGAGSGDINKSITEIVEALFDIEAHKIKVVKMGGSN